MTGRDINVMSAALTQFFGMPNPLHRYRHRPTSENSIRYKPELGTELQTGSTNNLATETDIDAVAVAIPMFCLYNHWDCVDICFRC